MAFSPVEGCLRLWRTGWLCSGALVVTYPPPAPCASTRLSKRGVGVEPLFSGFFGTAVFRSPECKIGRL